MTRNYRLLFGPLAGIVLGFGIAGLALLIPGYSHVHQTVSEIGEIGSPARVPFAAMLGCVAVCILLLPSRLRCVSGRRPLLIGRISNRVYGVAGLGIGVFAYPHPAHNVFRHIGTDWIPMHRYRLAWHGDTRRTGENSCRVLLDFLCTDMGRDCFNLSPFASPVWAFVKPVHGVAQRALFASGLVGALLH